MTRAPKHTPDCDAHSRALRWLKVDEDDEIVLLRCDDTRCGVEWPVTVVAAKIILAVQAYRLAALPEVPR